MPDHSLNMLLFAHVLGAAIWFGTALTFPFWGRSINRASRLETVLDISDRVFQLKLLLVMGGLAITLVSGILLTLKMGYPFFSFQDPFAWLGTAQVLVVFITLVSCLILYLMIQGLRGRRSRFRYVPPLGYNNIALIALVYMEMTLRPAATEQWAWLGLPLVLLVAADLIYARHLYRRIQRLRSLSPEQFVGRYFQLLRDEDMTWFFRMFHDDAEFHDPFATGPVRGLKAIERFFQSLGDQFEDIDILPRRVLGQGNRIVTEWTANGITRNGAEMQDLQGVNVMELERGKIRRIDIFFDSRQLPPVTRVSV